MWSTKPACEALVNVEHETRAVQAVEQVALTSQCGARNPHFLGLRRNNKDNLPR